MRLFVGAAALAAAFYLINPALHAETVPLHGSPENSVLRDEDAPSPYLIRHSDELIAAHTPASKNDAPPPAVPLPGAAWAGIAMMGALLVGRHIQRRRRRLV